MKRFRLAKFISLLLAVLMISTAIPNVALAEAGDTYSVTYVDSTNTPPTDSHTYASGDTVTVLSSTNREGKTGHEVFYYWQKSTGGTIQSGETFQITANTTLTAVYGQGFDLNLQVKPKDAGTITKSPDYAYYAPGTAVTVTATPSSSAWALIGYFKNFGSNGSYSDMLDGNQIVIQDSNTNKVFAVFGEAYGYTVKYYQDSTAGTLLGTDSGTGLEGSAIPYTNGKYLPTGYVTPGTVSGQTTITKIAGNNVLYVVYTTKGTYNYTVKYYKDSIEAANLLNSDVGSGTFGGDIPYTDGKYLPTNYVTPGVVSGQRTITAVAADNVLNVVYNKGSYGYTVNYYKDSIAVGNLLKSDTGIGICGDDIPYTDGLYMPVGYKTPGVVTGQTTITATAADNVLNVVYGRDAYGYTVNYYRDSVTADNLLGSDAGTGTFGGIIPYTDGKNLPVGYVMPGAVTGQETITAVAADNVLNVVYSKGSYGYTVNYYKDSIAAGNRLNSDTGTGTFGSIIPYTNGKYLPTGYVTPGAVSGRTTITTTAADNVRNVVYSKGSYGYTVNYYKDSVAAGNLLNTDTGTGTFGEDIPYTDGNYLPAGYVTPGAVTGQTTITATAADNVLNVVYGKGTYRYAVNYYKDSIAAGNLLEYDLGTGLYGSDIPYTNGKYLPAGYVAPGTVTGQKTITATAADNVLNVVYVPDSFAVTYLAGTTDTVAGIPAGNAAVSYTSTYDISSAVPTRAGYTFTGWSTSDVSGLAETYTAGGSFTMPDNDVTLTATWSAPILYGITYVMNGGTNAAQNPTTYTVTSGLITLADPTRAGYTFLGWTATDNIPAGSTGARTFTATWSAPIAYAVNYVMNGGTNSAQNPATYTVVSPTITLADPTRAGYTFLGWTPTDTIATGSTGARTFTATWSAPIAYNITYVMNGGTNSAQNPATYTVTSGLITLADPTRAGYTFLGWTPTDTIPAGSTGARTFTATWSDPIQYTLTYLVTGGTDAGLDGTTPYATYTGIVYGAGVPVPVDPAQDGYVFNGWDSDIPATMPDSNLIIRGTLTAQATEVVPETQTPLAGPTWALLNLILTIATALGIATMFTMAGRKRSKTAAKSSRAFSISTLIPAVGAVIAFLLTENMKNTMVFTDQWTLLMAGIALVQVVLVALGLRRKPEKA